MKSVELSIILVNYNSYDLTKETIHSIENHSSDVNYEIIVVDNDSKDNSGKSLSEKFPQYKFILNDENLGFAAANNQGVNAARGRYILILNNDILFKENSLKILLNYLSKVNGKVMVAPRLLNPDGSIQPSTYRFQSLCLSFTTYFFFYKLFPKSKYFNRYYMINNGISNIREVETITGAFILMSKKDYVELGGFDEDYFFYGEDNDLCKRFRECGGKIIYHPSTEVIHLKGGTEKTDWFHEKYHAISVLIMFKKHYKPISRLIANIMFFCGTLIRIGILFLSYIFTFRDKFYQSAKLKARVLRLIIFQKVN